MHPPARSVRAYALAIALAAAALGLAWATLKPFGGPQLYFPLCAVFASALYGGLGPGLVAVGLGALGFDVFFLGPPWRLGVGTIAEAHQLAGFVLFGAAAAMVSARSRSARVAAQLAEAEAKRVGELQERLVAMVSHDLRSPLSAMRTGLDLLPRLGPLGDRQRFAVDRMRRTTRRMESLVGGLLDLAHGRQGDTIPLRLAPAKVGEIAARAISEAETALPGADIRLEVQGDDQGLLDARRVEQVAVNLVRNALDHGSHEAPVEVRVRGMPEEIVLEVRNGGPPIPPEALPGLFEPFHRGTRGGNGLGLGLFIVKEVVRAHGGSVHVLSDPGGTAFAARLPRSPRRSSAAASG